MPKFIIIMIFVGLIAGFLAIVAVPVAKDFIGNTSTSTIFSLAGFKTIFLIHPTSSPTAPRKNDTAGSGSGSSRPSDSSQTPVTSPAAKPPTPPPGFTAAQLSPYFEKISIGSFSLAPGNSTYPSVVSIRSGSELTKSVDITGWTIRGNRGNSIRIPGALNDYTPWGSTTESDIRIGTSSEVYVYSTKSSLGRNLRINLCTGYLNDLFRVSPSLPNECPSINRDALVTFRGECQSYALSIGACQAPTTEKLNQFSTALDQTCHAFLQSLNYAECHRTNIGRADFFKKEWRTWINMEFPFDPAHDQILLLDSNGLLVSRYVY